MNKISENSWKRKKVSIQYRKNERIKQTKEERKMNETVDTVRERERERAID